MAFHPYPPLIRAFCNRHRCGPPPPLTAASPWPWVAHPVSGLPRATPRPLRTRCRCGSGCRCLSLAARDLSPVRSTKSTPSPARGRLRRTAGARFQALFHSPRRGAFHHSLAVLCAIGRAWYSALGCGHPCFRRDCTCPAVLTPRHPSRRPSADGALTRCGHPFQWCSARTTICNSVGDTAVPLVSAYNPAAA